MTALFGKKSKNKKEETPKEADLQVDSKTENEAVMQTVLPKGEDAVSYQAILSPHITEKGSLLGNYNKYVFKVSKNSSRVEIKRAIEKLYKVKVENVNVAHMPSKFRQVGRQKGHKPGYKKAIITLKQGEKIEITA